MHHWIARSPKLTSSAPPISIGIAAGCPFCKAREDIVPKIGKRIWFLSDGDIGLYATRVNDSQFDLRLDQFAVKMDYEKRGYLRNVTRFLDLFVVEPFAAIPKWMPQFSIQDVLAIHEGVLHGFLAASPTQSSSITEFLQPLISYCWQQRIPTSGDELWPLVAAHGFRPLTKSDFVSMFDFGFKLLIYCNGRAPIKRKRMLPLSKGRYLSDNARKMRIEHFGHD